MVALVMPSSVLAGNGSGTGADMFRASTLLGDLDGDGTVDVADVTLLITGVMASDMTGIDFSTADVNRDNLVDVEDVTLLIAHVIGDVDLNPPATVTYTVNGVSFVMVSVEGGTFMMGATQEQGSDAFFGEKPAHEVTLSSFAIGETEVTQALWVAVMGKNPSRFTGNMNRPVDKVSWDECQEFIAELNKLTGRQFRLPTEAEWEYAARGGNQSQGFKFPGSNTVEDVAWYFYTSNSTTQPVAGKLPNELGLYDMSGNVWEWCQDWYGYYSAEPQTNPTGAESSYYRVCRGGGWDSYVPSCRVSSRGNDIPSGKYNYMGMRLAL